LEIGAYKGIAWEELIQEEEFAGRQVETISVNSGKGPHNKLDIAFYLKHCSLKNCYFPETGRTSPLPLRRRKRH